MNRSLLITGGAGFIGSNFVEHILKDKNVFVFNLDKLTYAGNLDNLNSIDQHERYHFIKGDICDRKLVEEIFEQHRITDVIHFAAESHVDNSIKNPRAFIETNIVGSFNLLDVAYKTWMDEPNKVKPGYKN
jgi:dTDP-glucose 4,6-dehydratase